MKVACAMMAQEHPLIALPDDIKFPYEKSLRHQSVAGAFS